MGRFYARSVAPCRAFLLPRKKNMDTKKAKVVLGKTPKTFKKSVPIILIDDTETEIEFTFIYRTRKQFAEMIDEGIDAAVEARAEFQEKDKEEKARAAEALAAGDESKPEVKKNKVAKMYANADRLAAELVLKIATGWDLDDAFSEASLLQLEDEHPGSLTAAANVYRNAVAEARVKNS
jgi:hypothetical protein